MNECAFDVETELFNHKENKHLFNVNFICGAVAFDHGTCWDKSSSAMLDRMLGCVMYAYNATFDVNVLARDGVYINTQYVYDVMLMAWLLDENSLDMSLNGVALYYLGEGKTQSVKKGFVPSLDVETAEYVKQDALLTLRLAKKLRGKLADEGLTELFETIDQPFMWILNEATKEGCNVNQSLLDQHIIRLECDVESIRNRYLAMYSINIDSSKQVWKVLYNTLHGIPKHKDGITPKTDSKTIASLPAEFLRDDAKEILEYRKKAKYLSTFLLGAKNASSQDGLIHPIYNMCRAKTGRLSSGGNHKAYPYSFNIQNVTNKNPEVREAICAKPGTKIVVVDASQLELRVLAHYSEDPVLLRVFKDNLDPHRITAALLFSKEPEEITVAERSTGKTINFSVLYGSTEGGLEYNSGLEKALASKLLNSFYEQYQGVTKLKQWVWSELLEKEYITSLYGRRRRFPGFRRSSPTFQKECHKQAFSALIQGTAMDLMKECAVNAMVKIPSTCKFFLQVHDEFGFYVPEAEANDALRLIKHEFEAGHRPYKVPILFEGAIGSNWWEAKHG